MAQTVPLTPLDTSEQDDPRVLAEQRADDYSTHVVPFSARVGRWQLAMSFWSILSAIAWLFYGALVAGLYGTTNAVIALAVSIVIYRVVDHRERGHRATLAKPTQAVAETDRRGGFALVIRDRYLRLLAVMLLVATMRRHFGAPSLAPVSPSA